MTLSVLLPEEEIAPQALPPSSFRALGAMRAWVAEEAACASSRCRTVSSFAAGWMVLCEESLVHVSVPACWASGAVAKSKGMDDGLRRGCKMAMCA